MITHERSAEPQSRRGPEYFERHEGKVDRGLAYVEAALTGRRYCVGESLTLADIAFAAAFAYTMNNLPDLPILGRVPAATAHADALNARPAFQLLKP